MSNHTNKGNAMHKASIDTKYLLENSVVVSWSDGVNLYFDPCDLTKAPVVVGADLPTNIVAYRTVISRAELGNIFVS